jgi:ubiquinone/menaquinone biosynthesis C-methylase UbiE
MNINRLRQYFETNKKVWNRYVSIHEKSKAYNIDAFKKGKSSLHFVEKEELGDVSGKSLLHLQCHFGMDTLSWARSGAKVTGIDFSEEGITLAKSLAQELSIDARFIHSNIYDLRKVLDDKFDLVFTSYGVLAWLPDLKEWGRVIHHFLKENAVFYMVEFHPVLGMFDDEGNPKDPYFHSEEPMRFESSGTYAEPDADFSHVTYEWFHSMSDIVSALIEAGLHIESLHEFPFSISGDRPFLEKGEDGSWRHKNKDIKMPLMFSIKAKKPAPAGRSTL